MHSPCGLAEGMVRKQKPFCVFVSVLHHAGRYILFTKLHAGAIRLCYICGQTCSHYSCLLCMLMGSTCKHKHLLVPGMQVVVALTRQQKQQQQPSHGVPAPPPRTPPAVAHTCTQCVHANKNACRLLLGGDAAKTATAGIIRWSSV